MGQTPFYHREDRDACRYLKQPDKVLEQHPTISSIHLSYSYISSLLIYNAMKFQSLAAHVSLVLSLLLLPLGASAALYKNAADLPNVSYDFIVVGGTHSS